MGGEETSAAFKRDVKESVVRAEVERLLRDESLDDAGLRSGLEQLAKCFAFSGLTWLWGPDLYRRNRVLFRPFILSNFASWRFLGKVRGWSRVRWRGEVAQRCEAWMQQCDELIDMELFDRLWTWKHSGGSDFQARRLKVFRSRLVSRLKEADSPARRVLVLRNFRLWFPLDEETACALYRIDPKAAGPFLRNRIPTSYWSGDKRVFWKELHGLATAEGDTALADEVYRRTVPFPAWRADIERHCREVADASKLNEILAARHPAGHMRKVGEAFVAILRRRGRDVLPYVQSHLRNMQRGIVFRGAYHELLGLARDYRWWDLWTATVRIVGGPAEFNAAVREVLGLPDNEARERLSMLAGMSREFHWRGFSAVQVPGLDDTTALALYEKFPDLLRRAFRPNLEHAWTGKKPQFVAALVAAGDEDLIDYVASRAATRTFFLQRKGRAQIDLLADYYEALKMDPAQFARRACAVLTQIPAFTIHGYRQLIKENRLARLLLERSPEDFLAAGDGLRDLVEAQEIHVMSLAYRLLAMDDPRARVAAAANVDVLLGTLLRPIRRRTRLRAFAALANAAADEQTAARILAKAREALDLPDRFYPKEELVGLMGRLLHRWPALRGENEHPRTFRAA